MKNIDAVIEKHRELIFEAERHIWKTPETGFREVRTSAYMAEKFRELGYEPIMAGDIPGFFVDVRTEREGPTVLVLAELDSVICSEHKDADTETGAVHACGHHAQCAAMLGVAAALRDEEILSSLSGVIRLCCVPAEECLELEYRSELRDRGVIKYLGGKSEFLSRGYFDGVDMAFMVHTGNGKGLGVQVGCDSAFLAKTVVYKGVSAHAGCAAHLGRNALYAATAGLNAVNALRETFKDEDKIRWHPIITHGGDIVNNIPGEVVIESQIRSASYDALREENKKIDRALIGAAISFGVEIEIHDEPGYAPLKNCEELAMVARDAFLEIAPEKPCNVWGGVGSGATDMGDLSMLMPVIHPYIGGSAGLGHGADYAIVDSELACVINAKLQVATLKLLLEGGAERAKKIISGYEPQFKTKEEFLKTKDEMRRCEMRVIYSENGRIKIVD